MDNKKLLAAGTILSSDADRVKDVSHRLTMAGKLSFGWLTSQVVLHSVVATALSVLVRGFGLGGSSVMQSTGFVLGLLLVVRCSVGSSRAFEAAKQLSDFGQNCRTLSMLATHVSEAVTIAAGAEQEKKATSQFRFELVRLLNMAWYSYQLTVTGAKMSVAPEKLRSQFESGVESNLLSKVKNPTLAVVNMIAKLVDRQSSAGRVRDAQAALFSNELKSLFTTYHNSQTLMHAPPSATLNSFMNFMVLAWVYISALLVGQDGNPLQNTLGFFFTAAFFLGLHEASQLLDKPFKAVVAILDLGSMTANLSEDLTSLVDDSDNSVPVFLTPSELSTSHSINAADRV